MVMMVVVQLQLELGGRWCRSGIGGHGLLAAALLQEVRVGHGSSGGGADHWRRWRRLQRDGAGWRWMVVVVGRLLLLLLVVVLEMLLLVVMVVARLAVKAVPRMHSFGRKWSVGC